MGVSKSQRAFVFGCDNHRCRQCGSEDDLTIDHIKPKKHGGPSKTWNLQTLCRTCNEAKADAMPDVVPVKP